MTEHTTPQIDLEAETIIDLTENSAPSGALEPAMDRDAEAEPTIDLTSAYSPVPASEIEQGGPDEHEDQVVEQAAELIHQIDAEVEASAEAGEMADDESAAYDVAGQAADEAAEEASTAGTAAPPAPDVPLRRVLEAVLLIAEDPLPVVEIASRLEVPAPDVEGAIHELAAEYEQQERGFALREVAGGWRYYTAAECAPEVERFLLAGQTSRLSQAALETLAVVAYQQPVSRSRIAAVRGVSVDGVMKTLVTRGLIAESGTDSESGAIMYVTTPKFLERLGLRDLSELPPLAPLLPGLDELPEE